MNLPKQLKPVSRQSISNETLNNGVNPSVCVTGNVSGNKACVKIPVLGNECFTLPFTAPIGASVKACTCGSIIPTGAKITVSVAGATVWSKSVGSC